VGEIKVTVWNEYLHEVAHPEVAAIYPNGIHNTIGDYLKKSAPLKVRTAILADEDHGLTVEVLNNTDVLIWWGHMGHDLVRDDIVERIYNRVHEGMGLIVLHSGHASKIFAKLMGTPTWSLKWREDGLKEKIWVVEPGHPITAGIGECIELEHEGMYGERFDIPAPEKLIIVSWFEGGEVFRSGCCYTRGKGNIFYFRPGHETYPTYHNQEVLRVIKNAVYWASPVVVTPQ